MPLTLTAVQVQSLAPDASSVAAGKKLAKPGTWKSLGQSQRALWGECQGSAVYQTQVSLADLTSKCSCPSRKFPCKHALGLLLLAVDAASALPMAPDPEWVTSWLEKRGAAQEKKLARAEAIADKPFDVAAQAKRAEKRHQKVSAGIDQLDAWLRDLIRQGLAKLQSSSLSVYDAQARRLVDAQAPGLAARVRELGTWGGHGEQGAARLLDELGALALLTHAYRRIDQLDALLADDVRRMIGFTLEQSEVIAHGDLVEDDWLVVADAVEDDERVRVQRSWLLGRESRRCALLLQYAAGTARLEHALITGSALRARLAFWPSAAPQRALIVERSAGQAPPPFVPPGASVAQALDDFAGALARLPWLDSALLTLGDVVPLRGEPIVLADASGQALPLAGDRYDLLFAISGGHPITIAGEWNGYEFVPRSAWAQGRLTVLERTS